MTTKTLLSMLCLTLLASRADTQSVTLPLANELAEDADPELSHINTYCRYHSTAGFYEH